MSSPLETFIHELAAFARRLAQGEDHAEAWMALGTLRQQAKDLVIWLELQGHHSEASQLDHAFSPVLDAAHHWHRIAQLAAKDSTRRAQATRGLTQAVDQAMPTLTRLAIDLPTDAFEGFDDA